MHGAEQHETSGLTQDFPRSTGKIGKNKQATVLRVSTNGPDRLAG